MIISQDLLKDKNNVIRYAGDTYPYIHILKIKGTAIDLTKEWEVVLRYNKDGDIYEIIGKLDQSTRGKVMFYPHDKRNDEEFMREKVTDQMVVDEKKLLTNKIIANVDNNGTAVLTKIILDKGISAVVPIVGKTFVVNGTTYTVTGIDETRKILDINTDLTVSDPIDILFNQELVSNQCWTKNDSGKVFDFSIIRRKKYPDPHIVDYEETMTHHTGKLVLLSRV